MYRLFVPVNIILAGLVLVASVLPATSTILGANTWVIVAADIGVVLLVGTLLPSSLLRAKMPDTLVSQAVFLPLRVVNVGVGG